MQDELGGWELTFTKCLYEIDNQGLPWWFTGKESTCQARDTGLIPGSGSPGEGNGNPL